MKNVFKLILVIMMILSLTVSVIGCGEGEKGEQGLQGDQGPQGDKGDPGENGVGIKSCELISSKDNVDTYQITYTNDTVTTFTVTNGTDGADGIDGADGKDGVGIADAIVNSNGELVLTLSNGASLNLGSVIGSKGDAGEPGKDGTSFRIDATGGLSERGIYDGEPAGFVFAAIVNDADSRTATWYFYKKRSNSFGDWCDPLIKVEYGGRDGDNAKLIPCVEFTAPPGVWDETRYLSFSLKDYPSAWISAVVIDTGKGEQQLPFNHDQGIRQLYKQNGMFYLYFGSNVPAFETGRIYFSQGITPERENDGVSAAITALAPVEFTAPENGYFYISVADYPDVSVANVAIDTDEGELTLPYFNDAGVARIIKAENKIYIHLGSAVQTFDTGRVYLARMLVADASDQPGIGTVSGNMYYGIICSNTMTAITQLSADELTQSLVVSRQAKTGKFKLETAAPGSWTFILLPAGLTAQKDDGFGGKAVFAENNGAPGTGANGTSIEIEGVTYNIYGEFNLVAGQPIIYVEDV